MHGIRILMGNCAPYGEFIHITPGLFGMKTKKLKQAQRRIDVLEFRAFAPVLYLLISFLIRATSSETGIGFDT